MAGIKPEIAPPSAPARRSRWSAQVRRAWRARSSSRAPATTCTCYEKLAKAGGLLRYGIPDFKMEKHVIDRRVAQMEAEGVTFHYDAHVGVNVDAAQARRRTRRGGADRRRRESARDLPMPGRELKGIHFAMDFLPQQNRRVSDEPLGRGRADPRRRQACRGHRRRRHRLRLHRHLDPAGRASRDQFRDSAGTAVHENKELTWPNWPLKLRTSSSHEEGAERDFAVMTTHFSGANGYVKKLHCVHVDDKMKPVPGSEFEVDADLVLLAMGFVHPVHEGMIKGLKLALDQRGNIAASTDDYRTSIDKVFAAGDMRRGQSLVVWAIREGRQAAHAVDAYLMGSSALPR